MKITIRNHQDMFESTKTITIESDSSTLEEVKEILTQPDFTKALSSAINN